MVPDEIDFDTAIALLSLPRNIGAGLDGTGEVLALNGRYGPYIKWGKETRSMTPEMSPLTISLEEAHVLLKTPSKKSRGTQVLKSLGKDSEDRSIDLKSGRYGPYVTDGKTNATLPKDTDTDAMTLEMANEMLEKKRVAPPRKKKKPVRRKKKS
jgi:DNA topoisomerase-1